MNKQHNEPIDDIFAEIREAFSDFSPSIEEEFIKTLMDSRPRTKSGMIQKLRPEIVEVVGRLADVAYDACLDAEDVKDVKDVEYLEKWVAGATRAIANYSAIRAELDAFLFKHDSTYGD